MDMGMRGRTALVTGASRGIGKAVAEALAAEGVNLHLTATNRDLLEELAGGLRSRFKIATAIHVADLSTAEGQQSVARATGPIDILVNNAGAVPRGTLMEIDDATWRKAWDLKVFGYINMTRAYYPMMTERRSGVIVNIIGVAGTQPNAKYIATSMANATLIMFTESLGGESVRQGVRVVGVNPGPTTSDRFINGQKRRAKAKWGDESRWPEFLAELPLGRASTPEEVADMVVFLASDRAASITGTCVMIDGGTRNQVPPGF
jgi:NAD(P)-dependent dehydrogenase (short-subunit alcohol dehydrogenase family)